MFGLRERRRHSDDCPNQSDRKRDRSCVGVVASERRALPVVQYVPPHGLDAVWESVAPLLHRALLRCDGELDVSQLRLLCVQERALLFVSEDGCAVVEMQRFPNYQVAHVIAIGGKFIGNAEHYEAFKEALRRGGASKVQGWTTGGVTRLWKRLGLREVYSVMRDDL